MNLFLFKKSYLLLLFFVLPTEVTSQNIKTLEERLRVNDSLYEIAKTNKNDSLLNKTLGKYVVLYYNKSNWKLFNKYRKQHIPITYKVNDTISRAKTFKYTAEYFDIKNIIDSTYYYSIKSFDEYNSVNDSLQAGYRLLNLAILRKSVRDYTDSEYKCRLALKYLKNKAKPRQIASIYNTLGTNFSELGEYEKALEYQYKGLVLREEKIKDPIYIVYSLASIADVHITHKNYKKAIEVLNQTKSFNHLIKERPIVEAVVLDNLTYARFKNGETKNIEESFKTSLRLGRETKYEKVQINVHLHLAEYYKQYNNILLAVNNAKKAEKLSKKNKDFNGNLRALKLLSVLLNGKPSEEIIEKRDLLRDSLEIADKKNRRIFHSIELQIDDKNILLRKKDEELVLKGNKIQILIVLVIIFLFVIIYFYLIKRKQKEKLSRKLESTGRKLLEKKLLEKELKNKIKEEDNSLNLIKDSKDFKDYLIHKYNLTERGLVLIRLIFEGRTQIEQALELNIPESTLKTFKRTKFYPKLKLGWDVVSKQRATAELYQRELIKFNSLKINNI